MLVPTSFLNILQKKPETLNHTVNFQKLSKSTRPLPLAKKAMMTTLSSTMLTLPKRRMTSTLAELTTSKKYYHYYPNTASLNSFFYSNIFLENKCIVNLKLRLMCVFQPLFKFILCCKHKNISKENKSKCGSS